MAFNVTQDPWRNEFTIGQLLCNTGKSPEIGIPPELRKWTESIPCPFPLRIPSSAEMGLKISAVVILILLSVCGNLLVILVLTANRSLRTTTNVYIGNLAVSDLIVGVVCSWVHLGNNLYSDWPFGNFVCRIYPFLQILAVTASVLFLVVIAFDRFCAIVYPLRVRLTQRYSLSVTMVTWTMAVLVALPNIFVRRMRRLYWSDRTQTWCAEEWTRYVGPYNPRTDDCQTYYPGRLAYYTGQLTLLYFLPMMLMLVTYIIIIRVLWKRKPPGEMHDRTMQMRRRNMRKTMKMLVVLFLAFLICWTPRQLVLLYDTWYPDEANEQISSTLRFAFICLAYFNSAINPIIYAGLNEQYRKGFMEVLRKKRPTLRNRILPDTTQDVVVMDSNKKDSLKHECAHCSSALTETNNKLNRLLKLATTIEKRLPTINE